METPTLTVSVPARIQGAQAPTCTHGDGDALHRLTGKVVCARPGEVHFVVTPLPFDEDGTMQEIVCLMKGRMDRLVHIPCAGMGHNEVLDQIDAAGECLSSYAGRRMRLAIVCTDMPWDLGEYRSSLNESITDLRGIGCAFIASVRPEGEVMLDSLGEHERHFPLDYAGPIEPCPQSPERRKAAQRDPFDLLLSLCMPTFTTVDEASRLIRVSPERLRRLIRRGEVEGAVYVGTKIRIRTNALLSQFGISAREALPNFVNAIDRLYEIFVEGAGVQDGVTA